MDLLLRKKEEEGKGKEEKQIYLTEFEKWKNDRISKTDRRFKTPTSDGKMRRRHHHHHSSYSDFQPYYYRTKEGEERRGGGEGEGGRREEEEGGGGGGGGGEKRQQQQCYCDRRYRQSHIVKTSAGYLPEFYAYTKKHDGIIRDERRVNSKHFVDNYTFDPRTYSLFRTLCKRLDLIERSVGAANVLEIRPISNLVSIDLASKNSINTIYKRWIDFMQYIAHQLNGRRFEQLFWAADKYIFQEYFAKKIQSEEYTYLFIGTKKEYDAVENRYVKEAWAYDRNERKQLLYPTDKEYVHHYIDFKEKRIFLFYLLEEIQQIAKSNSNIDFFSSEKKEEPQQEGKSALVESHETCAVSDEFLNRDLRRRYLGGRRILFDTILDSGIVENLKRNVRDAGNSPLLTTCIILVHAMIHLKCRIVYGIEPTGPTRHSHKRFVEEVIRHIPSVLFGHPVLPLITVTMDNLEE